mmetsp:Transcript_73920/g.194867  ORF Transcript_73920/g.194867 Transcript_73920/m.194867 type:complete len:82 (+) Transcript_73920:403-648(+)
MRKVECEREVATQSLATYGTLKPCRPFELANSAVPWSVDENRTACEAFISLWVRHRPLIGDKVGVDTAVSSQPLRVLSRNC